MLCGDRPEVASLDATLVELGRPGQAPGYFERAVPGVRSMQGRPGVPRGPRELEWIEHEDISKRPAPARRRGQKVSLDRRGDRWAVPFEQRRHRQTGRLAGLRWPEGDQRVPMLGTDQPACAAAQRKPLVTRPPSPPERTR